ncbi:MAG: hypothetical protein IT377_12395 [Polyangiaceae bacterium]|nr:hypothetical protein [Polyangiaceae bacterium]
MKRSVLLLSAAVLSLASACKSRDVERSAAVPSASASVASPRPSAAPRSALAAKAREEAWAPPSPAPAEFTGTLTVERVAAAKSLLPAPKLAPKALPVLLAQLGKPTKVTTGTHALLGKEQKHYSWAAKSGTTCAAYHVVEQPNALEGWPPALAEDTGGGTFEKPKARSAGSGDLETQSRDYEACLAVLRNN